MDHQSARVSICTLVHVHAEAVWLKCTMLSISSFNPSDHIQVVSTCLVLNSSACPQSRHVT